MHKRVENLIKEMDNHLLALETLAMERDVTKIDEYIRSNDFRVKVFARDDNCSLFAYVILTKAYSDDDYLGICTFDNTIFAVFCNVVVCQKNISSNLGTGLDTTACWVIAYGENSSEREKGIARKILKIEN